MGRCVEVGKKYARQFAEVSKGDNDRLLSEVWVVTGG
jgi:hypothetical protein